MAKNTTISHSTLFTGFLLSSIMIALPIATRDKRINIRVEMFMQ
jgi:hypothetical protein